MGDKTRRDETRRDCLDCRQPLFWRPRLIILNPHSTPCSVDKALTSRPARQPASTGYRLTGTRTHTHIHVQSAVHLVQGLHHNSEQTAFREQARSRRFTCLN